MLKTLGKRKVLLISIVVVGILGLLVWFALDTIANQDPDDEVRFLVSPETTYYVRPTREDGSVNFGAAINAELGSGVAPEENGYAFLLEAIGPLEDASPELYHLLGIAPPDDTSVRFHTMMEAFNEEAVSDERSDALYMKLTELRTRPWRREDYPEIVRWIAQNRDSLERARQAAACDKYFRPLVTNDENGQAKLLFSDGLAGIDQSRKVTRLLAIRAMLELQEGETQAAWEDLIACKRLGRLVSRGPGLVDMLVACALESVGNKGIAALLSHVPPDAATIARYRADLAALPPIIKISTAVDRYERCMYIDIMQATALGRTEALEYWDDWDRNTLRATSDPHLNWNEPLLQGNAFYDESVTAMELPTYSERVKAADILEDKCLQMASNSNGNPVRKVFKSRAASIGDTLLLIMLPATSAVHVAETRIRQQVANIDTALALAEFRDAHGNYPESLAELVPDFLDEPPQDLFTANLPVYHRTEDGYALYSLGPDLVDQGGSDEDGADDQSIVVSHEGVAPGL